MMRHDKDHTAEALKSLLLAVRELLLCSSPTGVDDEIAELLADAAKHINELDNKVYS